VQQSSFPQYENDFQTYEMHFPAAYKAGHRTQWIRHKTNSQKTTSSREKVVFSLERRTFSISIRIALERYL
jgi:hypothetical protein